jgi:hypothetical protein
LEEDAEQSARSVFFREGAENHTRGLVCSPFSLSVCGINFGFRDQKKSRIRTRRPLLRHRRRSPVDAGRSTRAENRSTHEEKRFTHEENRSTNEKRGDTHKENRSTHKQRHVEHGENRATLTVNDPTRAARRDT